VSYGHCLRLSPSYRYDERARGGDGRVYIVIRPPYNKKEAPRRFRKVSVVNLVTGFTYQIEPGREVFPIEAEVCVP
jgi:hypothetical protein